MVSRQEKNKKIEEDIKNEEKIEKRKRIAKSIFKFIGLVILVIFLFALYMNKIGTRGIKVREYKITSNNLPEEFHGFKVVHFSDLHYLTTIDNNDVKELVKKINELNPDIVVFTGDLIDSKKKVNEKDIENLSNNLKNIKAKLGVYAIKGHDDYSSYYDQVISKTNIKVINNSYELIYYKGNTPIMITGVGSLLKDDCDIDNAFSYSGMDNLFTISLVHEPDVSDDIVSKYKPDIILAGHSHNGQIRLPFIGGLLKQDGATKYVDQKYEIDNTKLFISGGLGTSKYDFRLFNRPSINLYRLTKGTN